MRCKQNRRHEHGSLLDLPPEAKDSVLLEALPDVEDILILKRDESDLLKASRARLLDELHHWLLGRKRGRRHEVEFRLVF